MTTLQETARKNKMTKHKPTPGKTTESAPKCPLSVKAMIDFLNKTPASQRQVEESVLQIVVLQPGSVGGTPTVGVEQAYFGFDWDARKLLLYPLQPLTKLAPEDVAAIHKSAKEGQSWHAYQQYTRQANRIKALEAEIAEVRKEQQGETPFATIITAPDGGHAWIAKDVAEVAHFQLPGQRHTVTPVYTRQ